VTELELVVERRELLADSVVALWLGDPTGAPLPHWEPGAHLDLVLADGLVRQYSLCGDPSDRSSWRIAVLREPNGRGGSSFVHERLLPGAMVRVHGPRNRFPLHRASRYRFIAGGIGITPLLPMLAAASAAGVDWRLDYGGRTASSMAFADELRAVYGERVVLRPQDEHGVLDLEELLAEPAEDTLVYSCGPAPMLDAVRRWCAAWPEGALHVEQFTAAEDGAPVWSGPFEVELAVTGMSVTVPPDRSILEVLEEHGVDVISSCLEGICGSCETEVLDGQVDHRDSLLTPRERAANDTMFVCVSRAAGPKLRLGL
jgi:ferredoxin-NADP reductase